MIPPSMHKISYCEGYEAKAMEGLNGAGVSYTPSRMQKDTFLAFISLEKAEELRGLEGIASVLKMSQED
ncbi:MAG: hypothetical protein WC979_05435 [Candidatus Pacearchaeota archaeon]